MKGVQAPSQVSEVPGQTHPFEVGIEGPFGNGVIGQGIQDFFRDGFSLGQIDDPHGSSIHCIPEKKDFKGGRLGILIDTAFGQVHIAVCFDINTESFHKLHLEKSGEA